MSTLALNNMHQITPMGEQFVFPIIIRFYGD